MLFKIKTTTYSRLQFASKTYQKQTIIQYGQIFNNFKCTSELDLTNMALRQCTGLAIRAHNMIGTRNYIRNRYGRREIVGYFLNGSPVYQDRVDIPFPAVRFKESDDQIRSLKEKEKGDWKELCLDEKKALYRASFCQTFSEFTAPTGTWKNITAWVLIWVSVGCWMDMLVRSGIYDDDMLPITFDDEHRQAQFERIINLEVAPIHGISSQWDYDKDDWK